MKNSIRLMFFVFTGTALLSSCSSIINGSTQKMSVTSNVDGAEVMVNGVVVGKTPLTTRVKRESSMNIVVRKNGYETYTASMKTKLDPWFWGNIIIGGVLGSTTDAMIGSTHLIDPDNIYAELERKGNDSGETEEPVKSTKPGKQKPEKSKEN